MTEDNRSALVSALSFFRPYLGKVAAALFALIVASGTMLAMPVAVKRMIDVAMTANDVAAINRYFLILLGLVCLLSVFSTLRYYLVMWLGERVVADIRSAVYRHVLTMSPAFFETTPTGEVLSRLTTDTTLVQSVAGAGVSIALRSTLMLIGGLVMLMLTSPYLTGLILVLVLLVVLPLVVFGRRVRRLSRASQDCVADSSAIAGESLDAIQMIQAFTLEKWQGARFANSVEAAFQMARNRVRARALLTAFAVMIVFSAIMLVLWIGAQLVITQQLSAGALSQFLLYAIIVAVSTAALSEIWGEIQRAAGAMERLMELLAVEPDIVTPDRPLSLSATGTDRIQFDAVSFHYPSRPEADALKRFSLDVSPGETVALVGPSGAGKSTVFHLLLRFYDPEFGVVRVGGVDIAAADLEQIRRRIGVVPQETVIFAASALENIRYGRPDAADREVYEAARAAAADEFIQRLPNGYSTFLGERGIRLSGGQRQRIAIARAILKDAPILLLDEATSALDAESERLVQAALEHLMAGRTTMVIAHRLATVLKADRIVVMNQGRIVSVGAHEELIEQGGLYARLAALQLMPPKSNRDANVV